MAVGAKPAIGPGGLLLGAGEAGGVGEFSVRFRMVIKVDAGISRFDISVLAFFAESNPRIILIQAYL
jgi:hypothetical protein